MIIRFFDTVKSENSIDKDAISAGVYIFKIGRNGDDISKYCPLYIGESYCMLSRCSSHLYEIYNANPGYFGLTSEDLKNDRLVLHVEVYKRVDFTSEISNGERDNVLRDEELQAIEIEHPLAQLSTSDRLRNDRTEIVGKKIKEIFSSD